MNDDNLRARFAELKRRDAKSAPPFERMWHASRPKRSPRGVVAVVVPIAAAAAAVVLWFGAGSEPAPAPAAVSVSKAAPVSEAVVLDPAPLDFLLDMPNRGVRAATASDPLAGW